ncbi:MAG: hypothetical protein FIA95_03690, partial [Gemmatimonadetes bacterium]|nr:hypothetical protein [Gemmatimonadota bacterium]
MDVPAPLSRIALQGAAPLRAVALAAVLAAASLAGTLLAPSSAGAQGLTVRVAPEASAVRWKKEVGIEDATFLGGGLSLGFGRYVTLSGSYGTAGTLSTAFSASGYRPFDSSLRENRVRASLYSSRVLFRLGDRRVAPVLAAQGGVLDLEPEGRDRAGPPAGRGRGTSTGACGRGSRAGRNRRGGV